MMALLACREVFGDKGMDNTTSGAVGIVAAGTT